MQEKVRNILLLTSAFLLLPAAVQAVKGPQNVSSTTHNLSTGSGVIMYQSDNEDEVCIFCHTPHGGALNGPLWNRLLPDTSGASGDLTNGPFTHYNSATLSSKVGPVDRPVSDESLLCLSCHDGSLAVNQVINTSNDIGQPTIWGGDTFMAYFAGIIGGFIGKSPQNDTDTTHRDLADDHPISFSYQEVQSFEPDKLHTVAAAQSAGIRFFGATARLECSSCHDPHVDYDTTIGGGDEAYRPFLITPNNRSALCLACHDK